jgi:hypothetical protein
MAADDIKKHQFTSEDQPKKRRSRKGIPNRATVYKNLLSLMVDAPDPQGRGYIKLTLYEAMALGQMRAAMHGNTRAWMEIQDSIFGKQQTDIGLKLNPAEMKAFLEKLSDEELDQFEKVLASRGYNKIPMISIIEFKQQADERREKVLRQVEELDDDGP